MISCVDVRRKVMTQMFFVIGQQLCPVSFTERHTHCESDWVIENTRTHTAPWYLTSIHRQNVSECQMFCFVISLIKIICLCCTKDGLFSTRTTIKNGTEWGTTLVLFITSLKLFTTSVRGLWHWQNLSLCNACLDRVICSDLWALFNNFSQKLKNDTFSCCFQASLYTPPLACIVLVAWFYGMNKSTIHTL